MKKMQYDIHREATKISTLSSGKIDKCEYLTHEEILPSDQSRIIEQTKFTYSLLVKIFEKQIESQGKKQIKAIEEHGKQPLESNTSIKKFDYDTARYSPTLSKQKEVFNKFIDERYDKILELSKKNIHDDLTYHFKS